MGATFGKFGRAATTLNTVNGRAGERLMGPRFYPAREGPATLGLERAQTCVCGRVSGLLASSIHMAREKKGQYDRPSWSEIDKKRGKKSSSPPPPSADRPPDRWAAKQADAKFDALFVDPKKEDALQKVRDSLVKDAATFGAAVDDYKKDFGLPDDFDLLQRILEIHPSGDVKTETLEKMDTLVD